MGIISLYKSKWLLYMQSGAFMGRTTPTKAFDQLIQHIIYTNVNISNICMNEFGANKIFFAK